MGRLRVIQVKGGIKVRFEEIYALYFKDIFHYTLSLSQDPHLAEEITQETFFKALGSLDRYDGRKDIRAWLFTIAKHTYISHGRKDRQIQREITDRDTADDVHFVDRLLDEAQCFEIHKFLHTMEEPYKEVFNLRVFGELPFEKIGMIFGKSAGWARVTYHRAKRKIIAYMEGMEHEKKM